MYLPFVPVPGPELLKLVDSVAGVSCAIREEALLTIPEFVGKRWLESFFGVGRVCRETKPVELAAPPPDPGMERARSLR